MSRAEKKRCPPGTCRYSWRHGVRLHAVRAACVVCDHVQPRPDDVERVPAPVQRRYREGR